MFDFCRDVHKDYTSLPYTPIILGNIWAGLDSRGRISVMKKTYVKVTALICALILVVMVLGCALFTYFQIDKINTEYIKDIHAATKWSPADYEEESG